ncbi:MAG: acetamidase/formamidase family protein [Alphaproteobacteria bacterium]
MAQHHDIAPTAEAFTWGWLDPFRDPILRVRSGDTVGLTAWAACRERNLPPDRTTVDPRHLDAMSKLTPGPTSHMIVGPIHVEGAAPGDVLQVDILEASLADGWGYAAIYPLQGTLPGEFEEQQTFHTPIDRNRGVATLPWGKELTLEPFFGIHAVAPPPNWGRLSAMEPRKFGGNMDNKDLKPGTTLYLPVFNDGALFYAGDGHAVQGHGEVCVTAIETSMSGRFRLTVRKDLDYDYPFAESATTLISIGLDADLDEAARIAVRQMIAHVCRRTQLTRHQAYALCSLVGDLHVTQTVDGEKGCHMVLDKAHL